MKKSVWLASLLFLVLGLQANSGKELFVQKCSMCHIMTKAKDSIKLVAPPAIGIVYHLRHRFKSDNLVKKHIVNFVIKPNKKTSLKKAVKKFGLMPSQKNSVTEKELNAIADWMLQHYHMTEKEHKQMEKHEHLKSK